MAQAIHGGGGEQAVVRERLVPLAEVEIAGDDGARLLVALGDEVVQILVRRWSQGLQAKVIDDQQRHAGERGELALIGAGGAGGSLEECVEAEAIRAIRSLVDLITEDGDNLPVARRGDLLQLDPLILGMFGGGGAWTKVDGGAQMAQGRSPPMSDGLGKGLSYSRTEIDCTPLILHGFRS